MAHVFVWQAMSKARFMGNIAVINYVIIAILYAVHSVQCTVFVWIRHTKRVPEIKPKTRKLINFILSNLKREKLINTKFNDK